MCCSNLSKDRTQFNKKSNQLENFLRLTTAPTDTVALRYTQNSHPQGISNANCGATAEAVLPANLPPATELGAPMLSADVAIAGAIDIGKWAPLANVLIIADGAMVELKGIC